MGTLARAGLPLAMTLIICGANSGCSEPATREKTYEEIRAAQVGEFMAHLNNENIRERWRNDLIDIGKRNKEDRDYVIGECQKAYSKSLQRGGVGTGVLRTNGRRRVMEVVAALDDTKIGRELLNQGLEDVDEVKLAAAAAMADRGDARALPTLLKTIVEVDPSDAAHRIGIQALRRLAKPVKRATFLNALQRENVTLMAPIVLKTFPPAARQKALRATAASHRNPYARVFALRELIKANDPEAAKLGRKALDEGTPELRATALHALGSAGGDDAAKRLIKILRNDPKKPAPVVEGLFKVGSAYAHEQALEMFQDDSLKSATRVAIGRRFLARIQDAGAPAAYQDDEVKQSTLKAFRAVLDEGRSAVAIAAVDGIGKLGGSSDVQALLRQLEDPSPRVAPVVVEALGRLGGNFAAAKLVDLLRTDDLLREPAAKALANFKSPKQVPVDDLIDLLDEDELPVRKAALAALMGLSKAKNSRGYDPSADVALRTRGMARWRKWWKTRRGGR